MDWTWPNRANFMVTENQKVQVANRWDRYATCRDHERRRYCEDGDGRRACGDTVIRPSTGADCAAQPISARAHQDGEFNSAWQRLPRWLRICSGWRALQFSNHRRRTISSSFTLRRILPPRNCRGQRGKYLCGGCRVRQFQIFNSEENCCWP